MWYHCQRGCSKSFMSELARDRHEVKEHPRTVTEYMTVLAYENARLGRLRLKFEMQKMRFQEKESKIMNHIDEIKKTAKERIGKVNE